MEIFRKGDKFMTFQEYINNPTGIGTSIMSYRKMYEDLYHDKWDKIVVRENGHIDYTLYYSSNHYYCHIKVPSEVVEGFYYDVVIKMLNKSSRGDLRNAEARFFSNDPNFNYSFAHAFIKNKLHVEELVPKMSKEAIHNIAKEKNPKDTIGYVKALYFAFIIMSEKGLFKPIKYKSEGSKFDKKILLSNITDTEDSIEQRKELEEKQKESKKSKESGSRNKGFKDRTDLIHPEVRAMRNNIGTIKSKNMIGKVNKPTINKPNGINRISKKKGH